MSAPAAAPRPAEAPRTPRLSDWPAMLLFEAASRALCLLPRAVTLPAFRAAGRLLWSLMPGRRRVALENLAAALPELPEAERRRLGRASFGHAAAIAADVLTLPRVGASVAAHCETEPGSLELLRRERDKGRGVILVAGHFGLFESMGMLLGHEGFPVHFVAKPFDNPLLDRSIARRRGTTGNTTIHKGGAKAKARDVLRRGGVIAIVIDQHVTPKDRIWVPFFGLPAATSRTLGDLALDTGAPVVPIHSYPMPGGRCRCAFGPALDAAACGGAEALVHATIREMEAATRRQPEAWLWVHRRWKVRPDGAAGYPSYSETESNERRRIELRLARGATPGTGDAA